MKTFGPRNGWAKGDLVEVTPRHRELYPMNRARRGYIRTFGLGTMLSVKFEEYKHPVQIDERFVRKVEA